MSWHRAVQILDRAGDFGQRFVVVERATSGELTRGLHQAADDLGVTAM
jgi:hypothetical protein